MKIIQVKLLYATVPQDMEDKINAFLQTLDEESVKEIKFTSTVAGDENDTTYTDNALIIYEKEIK